VGEDSHGIKFIGHDGGGFGFSWQTRWYSDARMAVVVLTNSEPDDTTAVADNLAAAVLTPPAVRPFTGDASLLAGTYKGPGRGREMVIEVELRYDRGGGHFILKRQ
jgi:hypothetical protein